MAADAASEGTSTCRAAVLHGINDLRVVDSWPLAAVPPPGKVRRAARGAPPRHRDPRAPPRAVSPAHHPPAHHHQVRVAIRRLGICGSDIHFLKHGALADARRGEVWPAPGPRPPGCRAPIAITGRIGPYVVRAPMVIGHECAGVVSALGEGAGDASGLAVGDAVALEPGAPCWHCGAARQGRYNLDPGDDVHARSSRRACFRGRGTAARGRARAPGSGSGPPCPGLQTSPGCACARGPAATPGASWQTRPARQARARTPRPPALTPVSSGAAPSLHLRRRRALSPFPPPPDIRFFATPPVHGALATYVDHPAELCYKLPPGARSCVHLRASPVARRAVLCGAMALGLLCETL